MKVRTIFLAVVVVATVAVAGDNKNLEDGGTEFLEGLRSAFRKQGEDEFGIVNDEDPLIENILHFLFPNLTSIDPWDLEDGTTNFDSLLIAGHNTIRNNVMTGFSDVTDALWLSVPAGVINATFRLDLPSLRIEGDHESALSFLNNVVHFSGSGHQNFNLENLFAVFSLELLATEDPSLEITRLLLDAGFDGLEFQFENSELNCETGNWNEINQEIKFIFDIYWPVIRDRVVPTVQGIINEIIQDCNINELLEGNFDCITGDTPEFGAVSEKILRSVMSTRAGRVEYINPCTNQVTDTPNTSPTTPEITPTTPEITPTTPEITPTTPETTPPPSPTSSETTPSPSPTTSEVTTTSPTTLGINDPTTDAGGYRTKVVTLLPLLSSFLTILKFI